MFAREQFLKQLLDNRSNGFIKVITGVRRCGKSTLMEQYGEQLAQLGVQQKDLLYLNLEKFENLSVKTAEHLSSAIQAYFGGFAADRSYHVLLDEVQHIEHWERVVNALHAQKNIDVVITGSNAFLLSSELATLLSGRYITIEMFPLSFKEFLFFTNNLTASSSEREKLFQEYVTYGAFPSVVLAEKDTLKKDFLDTLYDSIVIKDIISRGQVVDVALLHRIVAYLLDTVGNEISIQNIVNFIKSQGGATSHETVSLYLHLLQQAFVFYQVKRYDTKGKKVLSSNSKYYAVDTGLRNTKTAPKAKNYGSVLENIVYLELRRRGYQVYVGKRDDLEIDFVCHTFDAKLYIQVSMSILDEKTREREFKSLQAIRDNFEKRVLTLDNFNFSQDGIIHQNLIDFLCEDRAS